MKRVREPGPSLPVDAAADAAEQAAPAGWRELVDYVSATRQALDETLQADAAMGLGDYEALSAVARSSGGMRITDLARGVGLSAGGCSRLVQRLVEGGLLERCPCPTDRRVSYACLTAAGLEALDQAHLVYASEVAARYGSRLSARRKAEVAELFGALGAAAGAESAADADPSRRARGA